MVEALLSCGKFHVTVLSRGDNVDVPSRAKLATVRYDQSESLKTALQGHDALVCTFNRSAVPYQIALIDAAIEVGVKRIIPSEFGANLSNENSRRLANYSQKVLIEEYLMQKSEKREITYTLIYNNVLLDWSIRAGVVLDFKTASIYLYNGGENAVSMASIPAAAKAVVGTLQYYEQTKNRAVCIHEAVISQKTLLAYAMEVSTGAPWTEEVVDLDALEGGASQKSNISVFHAGAMKSAFALDYGNTFNESDNELLQIHQLTKTEIKESLRTLAIEIKNLEY